MVKNEIINSGTISLKALGLFLYLKSKPKDWRFSTLRIRHDLQDGLSSIASAMQELERLKLLERRKRKNDRGQFEIDYIFLDQEEPVIEKPSLEIQQRKTEDGKPKAKKVVAPKKEVKPQKIQPPPKEPKEIDKLYSEMVKIYFDWFKTISGGVKPNFGAVEGSAMKKIINYFKSLHKDANDGKDEFEEVTKMFQIIFLKWNSIDPFYQDQTKVTQIQSNLQNIIIQIKNGHKRKQSTGKDKSDDARSERLQNSFNRIDEMLSSKK